MSKTAKYINIELDKPRRLLYTLGAMAEYERITGKNFLDLPTEKITATLLLNVLYVGLKHEDKSLTVEEVGAMITVENLSAIKTKIAEAASSNNPEPIEGEPKSPPAEPSPV
jgi:hypothetical protein